jgi:hypothetical protein
MVDVIHRTLGILQINQYLRGEKDILFPERTYVEGYLLLR